MTNDSWRDSYDAWKTRECDPDQFADGCRYCAEIDRQLAQQVEINTALRDVLVDTVEALKAVERMYGGHFGQPSKSLTWQTARKAITEAETILGGES